MSPVKQINNVGGVHGLTAQSECVCVEVINNSGGTLAPGDVVIIDVTGTLATTSATANIKSVLGVVANHGMDSTTDAATYASGAPMPVVIGGVSRIQIGANAVAALDILAQSGTVKQAVTNAAATVGQAIAIALEASGAKDANNTIRALIGRS